MGHNRLMFQFYDLTSGISGVCDVVSKSCNIVAFSVGRSRTLSQPSQRADRGHKSVQPKRNKDSFSCYCVPQAHDRTNRPIHHHATGTSAAAVRVSFIRCGLKYFFGRVFTSDPIFGSLQRSPDCLAELRWEGAIFQEVEGNPASNWMGREQRNGKELSGENSEKCSAMQVPR